MSQARGTPKRSANVRVSGRHTLCFGGGLGIEHLDLRHHAFVLMFEDVAVIHELAHDLGIVNAMRSVTSPWMGTSIVSRSPLNGYGLPLILTTWNGSW